MSQSVQKSVRTTCPYCGVGCGINVTHHADGMQFQGDESHPANFGRLCSKGASVGETLSLENRLLYPLLQDEQVTMDVALDAVAAGLQQTIAEHGPDAVAFYLSGQLLTEDYYVANKLMKGFIGSANVDTNSRLCMSSSVAGHKRAFGSDTVPGNYEDLEQADLIVLVGSNLAWCHPVLFQRISAARERNPALKIVVIDPRRTATCELADLHLALRPGSDTALFNGLLVYLAAQGQLDQAYIEAHTEGFAQTLQQARNDVADVAAAAQRCGLTALQLEHFYQWFAVTERTVTVYSQGVNQSSFGTDKVNTIINSHLATGRIGRPGMGPFSVTGQPNAMGGREVGGLATMLAAHMDFSAEDIDRVGRFWGASTLASKPGLKAVELFQAVADGRIKALWIMGTNPAVSLPDADTVRAALKTCPLVIVSEVNQNTDTAAYADILLPALAWGEKDGTVTNSERRISRQRAFLPAPGQARPDWWLVSQVARRLGYADAFAYQAPVDIFREHAALSAFENDGTRDFNLAGLAGIDTAAYADLQPVHWPLTEGATAGQARRFSDGRYYTPTRRARFIAIGQRQPGYAADGDYPLILNTGRVRDQWHTMTRTGKAARLHSHCPEPYAELHPLDATAQDLADGDLVCVSSRWGEIIVRARLTTHQLPGCVFVPMHWSLEYAATACVDAIVNPVVDTVSGQPESKFTPVRITRFEPAWHGFVLSRDPLKLPPVEYRVNVRGNEYWRYELAGLKRLDDALQWSRELVAEYPLAEHRDEPLQWQDFADPGAGHFRSAALRAGRLQLCVCIAPQADKLPPRDWLSGLFEQPAVDRDTRLNLLAGRGSGQSCGGPVVCSCFQVGMNTLIDAIRQQQLLTTEAIGQSLQAGTNCGSCLPELRGLLSQHRRETDNSGQTGKQRAA
ncbi:MAG: molybdopterin-dependent oxidoreductase [Gammaproteobacteria bacterium]